MLEVKIVECLPNVTLALQGELDIATGSLLEKAVGKIDLARARAVTFSLDGLKFIDSTGVGQLIGYYKSFAARNVVVRIANNNEDIEEVLQLIGVREIVGS